MNPFPTSSTEDPKLAAARLMQRAHNRDGLPELMIGLFMSVFAVLTCGMAVFPKGSPQFTASVLGLSVLCPALILLGPWMLKRIRSRYLVSRSGYVQPRRMEPKIIFHCVLLTIGMIALISLGTFVFPRRDQWVLLMTGLLGGAIQIWLGWLFGLPRFIGKGLFYLLSATILSLSGLPHRVAMSAWFGSVGLIEMISGAVVFRRFIAQCPPTEPADGE